MSREDDFSMGVKKAALERAKNRCERCWRDRDLEFHHNPPMYSGGSNGIDNCVVLCSECHYIAQENPLLFEHMFLRFASVKEMIQYYNVNSEKEAIEAWCREGGYNKREIFELIKKGYHQRRNMIKRAMIKKAKSGKFLGSAHPYGYDYKNGEFSVNEEEAIVVQSIFSKYLAGSTIGNICEEFNKNKTPTKLGGKWVKETVASILKNPLYCGFVEWDGILTAGKHTPIIDAKAFNEVQERIVERIKRRDQKYKPRLV